MTLSRNSLEKVCSNEHNIIIKLYIYCMDGNCGMHGTFQIINNVSKARYATVTMSSVI